MMRIGVISKENIMAVVLQFDFPHQGPWGDDMVGAMQALAESINQEPGFIWKIWTENTDTQEAGGVYLFEDKASALAYQEKHSARLAQFGVNGINAKLFEVNDAMSAINKAPIA
jgi:hypothetical protein